MVLLVEDDADLVEVLGMLFDRSSIPHVSARSLAEVQGLGDRLAGVTTAILDVNLGPHQPTGVEVAHWLREQDNSIRIVFITGHAPDHPLVREASAGGEVLAKPVDSAVLIRFARGEK